MITELNDVKMFGATKLQRQKEIQEKTADSTAAKYGLEFQGKYREFVRIEVSINFPVYRLKNGRTKAFQKEYLALNPSAPKDLFIRDHDAYEAQAAQHEILFQLAGEADLMQTFKKENLQQIEPLICTNDGIVVNGNRRLCVWRELYYSDKKKYKQFETISIVILPPATEEELIKFEKKLQIQNQMRAKYHWQSQAEMAYEDLQTNNNKKEVAESYDLTPKKLSLLIKAWKMADKYLRKIGKENQWSLVDEDQYAFERMVECMDKITSQGDKELFESLVFQRIETGSSGGRLYDVIPDIAKNLEHLKPKLSSEMNSDFAQLEDKAENEEDLVSVLAGDEDIEDDEAIQLAEAIRNSEDVRKINGIVDEVISVQRQLEKEKDAKDYLLLQVSKAATSLQNAVDHGMIDYTVNIEGVDKQLDVIFDKVTRIRSWLKEKDGN